MADLAGEDRPEPTPPEAGSVWCHTKTNTDYIVDFLVNVNPHDPSKFPLGVVYHRVGEQDRYHRVWDEFKLKFTKV